MAADVSDDHTTVPAQPAQHQPQWQRGLVMCTGALIASSLLTGWMRTGGTPHVGGTLEAHRVELRAEQSGTVQDLLLSAGQHVAAGDPVMTLERAQIGDDLQRQEARILRLQADLDQAEAQADVELAWRLKSLDSEILRAKLDAASYLKEQFACELTNEAWSDAIQKSGSFPPARLDDSIVKPLVFTPSNPGRSTRLQALLEQQQAVNAAEVYGVQIEMCDSRVQHLEELKAKLPTRIAVAHGVDRLKLELEHAEAELACLREVDRELQLESHGYGVVTRVLTRSGESVDAGQVVAELRDEARRAVIAQVPSHLAPRFVPGSTVNLVFPGQQEREGVVVEAALEANAGSDSAEAHVTVPIRIRPSGKLWPKLAFGSSVSVEVPELPEQLDHES